MRKKSSSNMYLQSEKKPGDVYVHRCTRVPGTQNCVVKVSLVPSFLRLALTGICRGLGPTFHPRYARHTVEEAL